MYEEAERYYDPIWIEQPQTLRECLEHLNRVVVISANWFGFEVEQFIGKGREQRLSQCRQVAMYLARELTQVSYPRIGMAFNRDHSTVMHAHTKIGLQMASQPAFKQMVEKIKRCCT